jgi:uncharacterized membrane protein YeaQ/YmgE (transglycosylase-associated protein family)
MMINVFAWIVIGLIAGCTAAGTRVNKRGESLLLYVAMAVGGALAGGLLFNEVRTSAVSGLDAWSVLFAALGAAISLVVWRGIMGYTVRA